MHRFSSHYPDLPSFAQDGWAVKVEVETQAVPGTMVCGVRRCPWFKDDLDAYVLAKPAPPARFDNKTSSPAEPQDRRPTRPIRAQSALLPKPNLPVAHLEGGGAMRYGDDGLVGKRPQVLEHVTLRLGVERTGGLVEQEHRPVGK